MQKAAATKPRKDWSEAAKEAARLVCDNDPAVEGLRDPREPAFASAVVHQLGASLRSTARVIQRVMERAASAAEDLNVEPYQGLIEVIQNADDLAASEVRFAVREDGERRQLLIVHNGQPVTFQHVLPMTLPFLTTKGEDANQKGRFGIGLKTLARIATRLAVHSDPYHFQVEKLVLSECDPEDSIANFYDADSDTLLVLDLKATTNIEGLGEWFDEWDEDGLLFLSNVRSFRRCDLDGETLGDKSVSAGEWNETPYPTGADKFGKILERSISTHSTTWRVYTAEIEIPEHLERAHKAKGEFTPISVAVPDSPSATGFFIAFKTRIPIKLPFSIDAQFDPSTAREELIDNAWNRWLVDCCANIVSIAAKGLLTDNPREAWKFIPLPSEGVGISTDRWPGKEFAHAFSHAREEISQSSLLMDGAQVPIAATAYEDNELSDLLSGEDVEALANGAKAISLSVRDDEGRWRDVLDAFGVSEIIGTKQLLNGLAGGIFASKQVKWWVEAGYKITSIHPDDEIFGVPFLLTNDGRTVACVREGDTARPLVFGYAVSGFSRRWNLLDQLHDAYGESPAGGRVRDWLIKRAAFTIEPSAAIELAAFAELHATPIEVNDDQLREIRDRFDLLSDRFASEIGPKVGRAILLNGHHYKGGARRHRKVSPAEAYLPRTLDSEHPDWPEAAGDLPGIFWISASYDEALKSVGGRRSRRRADGNISRGARKFLMLLGAECAPRLIRDDHQQRPERDGQRQELQERGAEVVEHDIKCPDLERVITALPRMTKRDRRTRGSALIRALSRHWKRLYAGYRTVPAYHEARRYFHARGSVSANWFCLLKESAWVVVGNGDLCEPSNAVIRSPQTETLYESKAFIVGIDASQINGEFAAAIDLIIDVRASDLVDYLRAIKDGDKPGDLSHIMLVYRTLSKMCPKASDPYEPMGDVTEFDARAKFEEGTGLICLRPGEWKTPSEFFSGRDIFHDAESFVPSGAAYAGLWRFLGIRPPQLADCTRHCRKLAQREYSTGTEAALMDIYRYMEGLLSESDRKARGRLAGLPLACSGHWIDSRPIYLVEDSAIRGQLDRALPEVNFWTPPCEVRDLPHLMDALHVEMVSPQIDVVAKTELAQDEGENRRPRFQGAVEHLSTELARNEPTTREKISITWDELRDVPLYVYPEAFQANAVHPALNGGKLISIRLRAFFESKSHNLHVAEEAIGMPKSGGRAIASLFPWELRPRIEAQWAASWLESQQEAVEAMRFATDEEKDEQILEATLELAATLEPKSGRIEVSTPTSRAPTAKPRRLKTFQGGITGTTVQVGTSSGVATSGASTPLATQAPAPSVSFSGYRNTAPLEFTNADLEQRGWEILTHALNHSDASFLVDFRKRHGVGADGAIDWTKFVELKASARSLPTSIEMTNAEYERAKERGQDYILALVYGLEEGEKTEARLIVDPVQSLHIRPVNGIRLIGLSQATAVVLTFADECESTLSDGETNLAS